MKNLLVYYCDQLLTITEFLSDYTILSTLIIDRNIQTIKIKVTFSYCLKKRDFLRLTFKVCMSHIKTFLFY